MLSSIDQPFVRAWRDSHQHKVADPQLAQELFSYLDTFPWGTSRLEWENVPNTSVAFGDGDPQLSWVEHFSSTPLKRHGFLMVAYAPAQEALIGRTDEVLADIDLLYAASPGPRYFCGADVSGDAVVLTVEDFAEFSDDGVRVHLKGSTRRAVEGGGGRGAAASGTGRGTAAPRPGPT